MSFITRTIIVLSLVCCFTSIKNAVASDSGVSEADISLYGTAGQVASTVRNAWVPILQKNPNKLKPNFNNHSIAGEFHDLEIVASSMPYSHAVVIFPWLDSSGALNNFPSTAEFISLLEYWKTYPLDRFRSVSTFVQETGLLPKCGLLNQLEYIFRFGRNYTPDELASLHKLFSENKVFNVVKTGEEAAYLLKDLVQDPNVTRYINYGFRGTSVYPLTRLSEVLAFLNRSGVIDNCRDGVVLRDIIASLRFFDLSVFENKRKRLQQGRYLEFALALRQTNYWDERFEAYMDNHFRNQPNGLELAEHILGTDSPITLEYYKKALLSQIDFLVSFVSSEAHIAEPLKQSLINGLVRIKNLSAAKHLRGFISQLRATNPYYLVHVIPTMSDVTARGIFLDQEGFERVIANICCIHKHTYPLLQPLISGENLIGLCDSKSDLVRIFFAFSQFDENDARGLVEWFKRHQIRKRLMRANDLVDVLGHLHMLLSHGAEFSDGKLSLDHLTEAKRDDREKLDNAKKFLNVEQMFLDHGLDAVYTPAFGDLLASYLESDCLDSLAKAYMSDLPMSPNRNHAGQWNSPNSAFTIISNNDGYDGVDEKMLVTRPEDTILRGSAFNSLVPIVDGKPEAVGYNVTLPDGKIKAVCVEVYGGFDTLKEAYSPGEIGYRTSYLLSKGVACISLNLPDLLRLNVFQGKMPEELHSSLHACIHAFYTILRERPEQLHPEMSRIKDKKLYLYGASFGGGNVVRHSKLYPKTFHGYISHDGQFDYSQPYLNAADESGIELISPQDSFLLLQNFDDACVSYGQAVWQYQILKNKGIHARLLISDRGNPMLRKEGGHTFPQDHAELRDLTCYKGHFLPLQRELYVRTINDFLVQDIQAGEALSDWRLVRYRSYLKRPYGKLEKTSGLSVFISEASRLYRTSLLSKPTMDIEPASIRTRASQEQAWTSFYEPLFRATEHLVDLSVNGASKLSIPDEHLTDENVDRALVWLLPLLVDHLYETEKVFSSLGLDSIRLQREIKNIISPALRQAFREKLKPTDYYSTHPVLLNCWILSNPQLAPVENALVDRMSLQAAKAEFLRFVRLDTGLRKSTLRQKVVEAAKRIKNKDPEALEIYETMGIN